MVHIPADILVRFLSHIALLKIALAKSYGLNPIQLLTLLLVGEGAVGISIKDLRQRLAVPGSSLTFTLDSLERMKLITRKRSKQDRRQWVLALTTKGKKLHEEMVRKENDAVSPSITGLSEDDKEAFLRISEEMFKVSGTSLLGAKGS
jgi:MarR family transcriptional regulator, 2-MHQ and catechol-resistance regulon repressor